jgi:glycosyltransferase involved in cell wall biosynthesis
MNPERVDMIYPAYDSTRFGAASPAAEQEALRQAFDLARDRPLFVFCGRLAAQKRPLDFLQLALRRLQKRDDAFFVMVGTGELAPEVDEFIKDNEVANLRRIPFLDNPAPLYSIASGLIMTSQYESLGIVMLEALSMGLPVLATDVGDIRLVLEQYQAGLVVSEIGSVDSLEGAYETWRANLPLYAARARRCAPEIRQRFSSETTAEQYAVSWERAMKDFDKNN